MSEKAKTYLYWSGILVLSILGVGLILIRQTNYGVGLMIDSLTHTSTAESLLRGEGFVTAWNSRPQQGQPPLYGMWLSIFATLDITNRFSVIEYAGYAGAIIFGLTILAIIVWIATQVKSRAMAIVGGSICTFSPFLGDLFSLALTETLFILATVLSLFILDRFLINTKRSMLILAANFSALAWLTRHIGITVIISSILVMMANNESTFRQKLNNIAIYSSISMLPTCLWVLRNYIVLDQFSERRWSTGFDWITSLNLISLEVTEWLMGTTGLDYLDRSSIILGMDSTLFRIIFLGTTAISVGLGLTYLYRKGIRISTRGLAVPVVFISVYSVALTASLILTDIDVVMRYLSPVYAPLVVAITIILERYYAYTSRTDRSIELPSLRRTYIRNNGLKFVIIASLSIHLVLSVSSSYSQVQVWRKQGFGYSSKPWADSETIRYLKSNPISGQIYSNEARAIYTHVDVSDEVEIRFNQLQTELPDEARYWDDSAHSEDLEMYVVWFHGWRPFIQTLYDFTQLISLLDLEIKMSLEDGIVLKAPKDTTTHVDRKDTKKYVIESILDGAQLMASSRFKIYFKESRLIYVSTSCKATHVEAAFFLHIYPTHLEDISEHSRATNFNNHDFKFEREGFRIGEICIAIRALPDYEVKSVRTGQFDADEIELWEESLDIIQIS